MSEWLTTGQMIDRLKVGEVAEVTESPMDVNVNGHTLEYENGQLRWIKTKNLFVINDFTTELKWKINPKYVTFEEAMKALNDGKTVSWQHWSDTSLVLEFNRDFYFDIFTDNDVTVDDFCEGKWTIED